MLFRHASVRGLIDDIRLALNQDLPLRNERFHARIEHLQTNADKWGRGRLVFRVQLEGRKVVVHLLAVRIKWFGYPTFWVNRLNIPVEESGVAPDAIGGNLTDLVSFVKS